MTATSIVDNTGSMAGGCSMHMAPTARVNDADCPMGSSSGCDMGDMGCDMAPGAAMVNMQANSDCPMSECSAEDMANCTPEMMADCPMKDHCEGGSGDCPFKGQMTKTDDQTAQADDQSTSDSEG